tara:strand:+ start:3123 stop:4265 length:1143 start_codon:yes stop_codon:yes gene_type:complete
MANTLGVYNPVFYAQEALIQLEKSLGMANRVYMGFDQERKAFGLGETINIRKPSTFSVSAAPATAVDVTTETVSMTLDNWREVKFKLSDKELAFTGERIINDHIRPAAYALANDIDEKLVALYPDIGNQIAGGTWGPTVITNGRKALFDQGVPLADVGNLHCMIGGTEEAELLKDSAFAQHQGAGDTGVSTQMRGTLGVKYGFEFFANQNVATAAASTPSDLAGAVDNAGGYAKGSTTVHIDGIGDVAHEAGMGVSFAGHAKIYSLASTTTGSSNEGDFVLREGLQEAVAQDEAVTFHSTTVGTQNLMFHKNAFGLVMAPLSEMGNELGANVAVVQDPVTGLALRSRVYYVGNSSEVHVALDVLYGVKTLDSQLAVRIGG